MSSRYVLVVLVAASVIGSVAATGSAANLLVNPSFDTGGDGWLLIDNDQLVVSHRSDVGSTLDGGSGPGALQIRTTFWTGSAAGTYQVVDVSGGSELEVAASVFVPSADNSAAGVFVFLELFDASSTRIFQRQLPEIVETGRWVRLADTVQAPADAVSARLWLGVITSTVSGETRPGIAIFDDALLGDDAGGPPSPVTVQSLFVPAAAAVHGRNGTYWSTDGWFTNLTDVHVRVGASLLRPLQGNAGALSGPQLLAEIPPHGFVMVEDVVTALGGDELACGLAVVATADGDDVPAALVAATTHTSTPNPFGGGAYGQGIPATEAGSAAVTAVPGVFQTSTQRTNVGVLNTSATELHLLVYVLDGAGAEVGFGDWTLQPYEQRQLSLPALGVGTLNGGTVVFEAPGSSSYLGYTSTVDQDSGDAVYNAAR